MHGGLKMTIAIISSSHGSLGEEGVSLVARANCYFAIFL